MMVETPLSVSELTARIKQQLERRFTQVSVTGEASRPVRHASGHLYFTIKDAGASLSAVIWRSTFARMTVQPEDGQAYIFSGHISVYAPRGVYQLIVQRVEPSGSGALAAEFERRKREFAARGWFDPHRKQAIPALPRHIGIVTSQTAAALQDVLKIIRTRPTWLRLTLSPATVQGGAAATSIARAITRLQQMPDRPDVILIVRGGGSLEDLWCFNEETVVRAIVDCPVPVITGIGHEIDVTLADFAADARAATPSNAAEISCPDVDSLRKRLPRLETLRQLLCHQLTQAKKNVQYLHARATHAWRLAQDQRHLHTERADTMLMHACREIIRQHRRQLNTLTGRLMKKQPQTEFAARMRRLSMASQRLLDGLPRIVFERRQQVGQQLHALHLGFRHDMQRKRAHCEGLAARLEALSPYQVLSRGYTLSMDSKRRLITSRAALHAGQPIHLLYHDGEAGARIENPGNAA